MNPNFDFSSFRSQYELQTAVRLIVNSLRNANQNQDVANDRVFAAQNEDQQPFEEVLRALNINEVAQEEQFDFELNGRTLAEVETECIQNQVDFMGITQNRGNKLYYNAAAGRVAEAAAVARRAAGVGARLGAAAVAQAEPPPIPEWIELSRPEAADPMQELSEIIFLDNKNTVADWATSLANLKD